MKYVEAIKNDVQWLGFEWDDELYASDYFEQAVRDRRAAGQERQGVRRLADRRGDPREPRHGHDAGHAQPVSRSLASTRISTCCAA